MAFVLKDETDYIFRYDYPFIRLLTAGCAQCQQRHCQHLFERTQSFANMSSSLSLTREDTCDATGHNVCSGSTETELLGPEVVCLNFYTLMRLFNSTDEVE